MECDVANKRELTPTVQVAKSLGLDAIRGPMRGAEKYERRTLVPQKPKKSRLTTQAARLAASAPDERQVEIYRLHIDDGITVKDIAAKYDLSVTSVMGIVNGVHEWIIANKYGDIVKLKADHDRRLLEIANLAMQEYERSKIKQTIRRNKKGVQGEWFVDTEEIVETERNGDPRYLGQALAALTKRSDLWGLDAPKKSTVTNAEGTGPLQVEHVYKKLENASDDDLRKARQAIRRLEAIDVDYERKEANDVDPSADCGSGEVDGGSGPEPVRPGDGERPIDGDEPVLVGVELSEQRERPPEPVPLCEAGLVVRVDPTGRDPDGGAVPEDRPHEAVGEDAGTGTPASTGVAEAAAVRIP
jgi:hypothetical protein